MSAQDFSFHTELLEFWFGQARDYWFGCPSEFDNLIKQKYYNLLISMDDIIESMSIDTIKTLSNAEIVATIILFDQLSRHIERTFKNELHFIINADSKARFILENSGILNRLVELKPEYLCFTLMPWRHTFDVDLLEKCLKIIDSEMAATNSLCRRFRQATLKALAKQNTMIQLMYDHSMSEYIIDFDATILDPVSPRTFAPAYTQDLKPNSLLDRFKVGIAEKYHTGPIIISVSGGVDSMVCLVLARQAFPTAYIVALSINYMNREEQTAELRMVSHVCRALGISHYIREIVEVKRTRDSDREFYETFTRDIRFASYKYVGTNLYKPCPGCVNLHNNCTKPETVSVPVILGHNRDDALENVFSNIKKCKNYDNLFGMTMEGIYDGVTILRPLLMTPKSEIVAYAQANSIPYTYDSTPDWCERGKMRDQLIPFLQNFDSALVPGLLNLVTNYTEIYKVYLQSLPTIRYHERGTSCVIDCGAEPIYLFDYWKRILTKVALHYKVPFAKNKSVAHFVEQLKQGNMSRLTLSKHMVGQHISEPRIKGYYGIESNNMFVAIYLLP